MKKEKKNKAPSIHGHMGHKARVETIRNMLRVWSRRDPEKLVDFLNHIKLVRKYQDKKNGMSKDGTFMLHSMRHPKMDGMMSHVFGNFWDTDPDVMSAYNEVCAQFKINQQSMPNISSFDRPTIKDGYQQSKEAVWNEVINKMIG